MGLSLRSAAVVLPRACVDPKRWLRLACAVSLFAACTSGSATSRDAAVEDAATTPDLPADVPDAAAACPATGEAVCTTGPRGAVTTSFGAGDCFVTAATGFVWQVPGTTTQPARALFCGDVTAVLGSGGPLDYPACMAETAITTASCQQTGGGQGTAPAKYEWYFQCASGCTTTIKFVEHGLAD